jgi:hypothetical protein
MVTLSTIEQAMSHGDPYHHMQNHHAFVSLNFVMAHIEFQMQLASLREVFLIKMLTGRVLSGFFLKHFRFYRIFVGILYPIKIPIPQEKLNPIGIRIFGRFMLSGLSLIIAQ